MPSLYVGIDGGGSSLRVAVADAGLRVRGQYEGPGANPSTLGRPRAAATIQEALRAALGSLPAADIAAVAIGVAGAAASHSRAWLLEVVAGVLPGVPVVPSADYEIALVGALGRREGIVVLAGTGALAYGVNSSGTSALAGAWGYLLGDEGGGYWLGREGLRAVVRGADGRGPDTALTAALLPALGLTAAADLIPWLYRDLPPVTGVAPRAAPRIGEVAALAPLVLAATDAGDPCARRIVSEATEELTLAAHTVIRRLVLDSPPIAFAGGLLSEPNALSTALCRALGLERLPRPLYPPVMGAVLLARDAHIRDSRATA